MLAAVVLSVPGVVRAEEAHASRDAPFLAPDATGERQLLIPLVEIPLMNVMLTTFNRFAFVDEWAKVSWETISRNLNGGWRFDTDDFEINNVGHPYQGSFPYLAVRSAGYNFWQAMLGAFLGSAWWEIAGEGEPPSVNDMITTTFGGAFLGEAMHRTSIALLRNSGNATPSWLRILGSVVLNPVGAFNRWLTNGRYDLADYHDETPVLARFSAGVNALGRVVSSGVAGDLTLTLGEEFHFGAQLRSGLPGHHHFPATHPFDHFDVRLEGSISREPYATLFVTGLMVGDDFRWGTWGHGVWGLFGNYDYANPRVLRVSTVSAGPGLSFAADLTPMYQLQVMAVASGIGWGAAGSLEQTGVIERAYHIGPGAQLFAEVQFINRDAGSVRATLRQYFVTGAYAEPGLEAITYADFGASVGITRRFELTFDVLVSARNTNYYGNLPDAHQRAGQLRVGLTWLTDVDHGATRRHRED